MAELGIDMDKVDPNDEEMKQVIKACAEAIDVEEPSSVLMPAGKTKDDDDEDQF